LKQSHDEILKTLDEKYFSTLTKKVCISQIEGCIFTAYLTLAVRGDAARGKRKRINTPFALALFLHTGLFLFMNLSVIPYKIVPKYNVQTLVVFAVFKRAFRNGVIFYHNGAKGVLKTGRLPYKSASTIANKIQHLIDNGFARIESGRVILTPKRNLEGNQYLKIREEDVRKEIISAIVRSKINRVAFSKAKKAAQSQGIQRKLNKLYRGRPIAISTRELSKLTGLSKSTMQKLSSDLIGIEKTTHKKQRVKRASIQEWAHRHMWWNYPFSISECFFAYGSIWRVRMSEFKLSL
jgi:hypothetical protein